MQGQFRIIKDLRGIPDELFAGIERNYFKPPKNMLKPTREQLTHLFTCPAIFKGINVPAAIDTFYAKIYPLIQGREDWCIEDDDQDIPQVAAMFAEISSLLELERILNSPDLWELGAIPLKLH